MPRTPSEQAEQTQGLAAALRSVLRDGYGPRQLRSDVLAGLSVGVIAVPLSLALAIASGAPPQQGLYTAFIAGALIALLGGSRYSVSGPTAAFVVILFPIAQQHGLGGLLVATMMAGAMQLAMGWARLGRFVEYIPYPVTTGFTAGIAVVIASLQLKDLFGLSLTGSSHFTERMMQVLSALPGLNPVELGVGLSTLAVLIVWPRLKTPVPGYLVAALFAGLLAFALKTLWPDLTLVTISDRFQYTLGTETGHGIPPVLPHLAWPWEGVSGGLSLSLLRELSGPAFAIAMLGAIESLLCAVVADGMTGRKHDPDVELMAQGIGNLVAPLAGGIPATGALARTAANVRAGAVSPLAAVVHALFVLAAMLTLAPLLSWLPMSGLAAMLLMVAWNMSERRAVARLLRMAPRHDLLLMLLCFSLTVLVDMTVAIGTGVVLGSLMFMHRMAQVSQVSLVGESREAPPDLPRDTRFYEVVGPLFFGAAERALVTLRRHDAGVRHLILDLSSVPTIDATGLVALEETLDTLHKGGIFVALCGAQPRVRAALAAAGYSQRTRDRAYFRSSGSALRWLRLHRRAATDRSE